MEMDSSSYSLEIRMELSKSSLKGYKSVFTIPEPPMNEWSIIIIPRPDDDIGRISSCP